MDSCPACSHPIRWSLDPIYCGACGAPVARPCPACAAANPLDHRRCLRCGRPLGPAAESAPDSAARDPAALLETVPDGPRGMAEAAASALQTARLLGRAIDEGDALAARGPDLTTRRRLSQTEIDRIFEAGPD